MAQVRFGGSSERRRVFLQPAYFDGFPAVISYDSNFDRFRFKDQTIMGTSWANFQVIDATSAELGSFCSATLLNGVPYISYYDIITDEICVCKQRSGNILEYQYYCRRHASGIGT
ncbi:MAG: hypothetical protein R2850_08320 [Bacteroidia bacterium]